MRVVLGCAALSVVCYGIVVVSVVGPSSQTLRPDELARLRARYGPPAQAEAVPQPPPPPARFTVTDRVKVATYAGDEMVVRVLTDHEMHTCVLIINERAAMKTLPWPCDTAVMK